MNMVMPDQPLPIAYSYARFSSEGQKDGNSIERQTKRAQEWAHREGYNLSTETFQDLGVSAFKGANVDVGALGAFLEAVESGAIKPQSVLVVENLDRLSRQHFEEGYLLIKRITQAGISVVTLSDNKMYRAGEQLELVDMITMIVGFERANQESKVKSERVGAAWKSNAEKVKGGKRKRTTKVPAWIEFKGDSLDDAKFEVIESKAELVREIFERYANGEPTSAIARSLRERKIPTLSGRGRWTGPLLYMLVREVTPYGTLQIGKGVKKDRKIIDEVKDYYPRIVDQEIQRRVKFRIERGNTEGDFRPKGETRGILVGVLRSSDGNKCKAKVNNRSVSYVDYVTNKFIGTVWMVDQVLIDDWPEVLMALDVETTEEAEGIDQELMGAIDALENLISMRDERPSKALDRMILSAEAEVEELKRDLAEASRSSRIHGALPSELFGLPIPEANQWVRRVVQWATVRKEGRGKNSKIQITLRLTNGIQLTIGDKSIGIRPR